MFGNPAHLIQSYELYQVIIEMAVIWICVYAAYRFLRGLRGAGALKGLIFFFVLLTLLVRVLGQNSDAFGRSLSLKVITTPGPLTGVNPARIFVFCSSSLSIFSSPRPLPMEFSSSVIRPRSRLISSSCLRTACAGVVTTRATGDG